MRKRKLVLGGLYRHFKGGLVKVLGEARHSETLEKVVIYIHLEDGKIWARPKEMFLEKITHDGKTYYRFEQVEGKE
jgi:hypothetical protein